MKKIKKKILNKISKKKNKNRRMMAGMIQKHMLEITKQKRKKCNSL
jgi:hypothetical protein